MMESLLNATRPNGTVATYTCDDGFRLDGNTRIRICDTGNWTATAPVCIESKPRVCTCLCGTVQMLCIYSSLVTNAI